MNKYAAAALVLAVSFAATVLLLCRRFLAQYMRDADAAFVELFRGFVLYLRPFDVTGALIVPGRQYRTATIAFQTFLRGAAIAFPEDFETGLERRLAPLAPLLALGLPGEHEGAARIREAADWFSRFVSLATNAVAIVIIPAASPGTLREISWLFLSSSDVLDRCVFVQPPASASTTLSVRALWKSSQEALAAIGITLVDYWEGGTLFRVDAHGTPYDVECLGDDWENRVYEYLKRLIGVSARTRLLRFLPLLSSIVATVAAGSLVLLRVGDDGATVVAAVNAAVGFLVGATRMRSPFLVALGIGMGATLVMVAARASVASLDGWDSLWILPGITAIGVFGRSFCEVWASQMWNWKSVDV